MYIGKIKLMSKERFDNMQKYEKHLEEDNAMLAADNDKLEEVNRLLNERITNLEGRLTDLILENNRLREVKHE